MVGKAASLCLAFSVSDEIVSLSSPITVVSLLNIPDISSLGSAMTESTPSSSLWLSLSVMATEVCLSAERAGAVIPVGVAAGRCISATDCASSPLRGSESGSAPGRCGSAARSVPLWEASVMARVTGIATAIFPEGSAELADFLFSEITGVICLGCSTSCTDWVTPFSSSSASPNPKKFLVEFHRPDAPSETLATTSTVFSFVASQASVALSTTVATA